MFAYELKRKLMNIPDNMEVVIHHSGSSKIYGTSDAYIGNEKYIIQRSKGLGENEPDMMSFTTMDPKTRRLIKVMPESAEETAKMFDVLLGDDLSGRKEYIIANGHLYTDNLDVS